MKGFKKGSVLVRKGNARFWSVCDQTAIKKKSNFGSLRGNCDNMSEKSNIKQCKRLKISNKIVNKP